MKRIGDVPLTAAERQRRWLEKHKHDVVFLEHHRARKRANARRNRASESARAQRWADANRDRVREISRAYYEHNIEAQRRRNAEKTRRRLAVVNATATERVDYAVIVQAANGICAICDEPVHDGPAHIDHIVPLSKGGTHTYNNLQFTHARCNLVKGAKLLSKTG